MRSCWIIKVKQKAHSDYSRPLGYATVSVGVAPHAPGCAKVNRFKTLDVFTFELDLLTFEDRGTSFFQHQEPLTQ
jgi:hypothetical protein